MIFHLFSCPTPLESLDCQRCWVHTASGLLGFAILHFFQEFSHSRLLGHLGDNHTEISRSLDWQSLALRINGSVGYCHRGFLTSGLCQLLWGAAPIITEALQLLENSSWILVGLRGWNSIWWVNPAQHKIPQIHPRIFWLEGTQHGA